MVKITVTMDDESYKEFVDVKPKYLKKAQWLKMLAMERLEQVERVKKLNLETSEFPKSPKRALGDSILQSLGGGLLPIAQV